MALTSKTTTVTTTRSASSNVAVHTISFRGLAGTIFVCLGLSAILYIIGFATSAWTIRRNWHEGLWQKCECWNQTGRETWFHAVQAMICIGLIGILVALILACIYLCVHQVSKNTTILALVIVCFLAVLFMLIGFIIIGAKMDGLNWSFAITVIAGVLCLVAGILAIVQMRHSGVRI